MHNACVSSNSSIGGYRQVPHQFWLNLLHPGGRCIYSASRYASPPGILRMFLLFRWNHPTQHFGIVRGLAVPRTTRTSPEPASRAWFGNIHALHTETLLCPTPPRFQYDHLYLLRHLSIFRYSTYLSSCPRLLSLFS